MSTPIPADVLDEIAVVLETVGRDNFFRRGRYEHGFANGIISFARAVTKTEQPLKVLGSNETYSEEAAAKTFETAALDLLRHFATRTDIPVDIREKSRQLIEAWGINSLTASDRHLEKKPAALVIGDRTLLFHNLREFWDCPDIRRAATDSSESRFIRFTLHNDFLCAVYTAVDCLSSSGGTVPIGRLEDPSNILRVCKNNPVST